MQVGTGVHSCYFCGCFANRFERFAFHAAMKLARPWLVLRIFGFVTRSWIKSAMVFDLVLSFFNSEKKYCITGLTSLRFSRRQKASRNLCAPPRGLQVEIIWRPNVKSISFFTVLWYLGNTTSSIENAAFGRYSFSRLEDYGGLNSIFNI